MNNYLQFYGQNQISPVSQNIDDMDLHIGRRIGLYRTLGLAASLFKGRDILEVAPGSGHNSIVTATFNPRSYDLVEPNPTGFKKMVSLFDCYPHLNSDTIRFFNVRLEDFTEDTTYDIVICEGLIAGLSDHDEFLVKLASKVRKGGILIVTCADAVSLFFETLRRYLAKIMVNKLVGVPKDRSGNQKTVLILLSAFQSHLNTLEGMSRPFEDWIWDNLVNPATMAAAASAEFSIEKCLSFLGDDFYFYGSSPVFMSNWSWYKDLPIKPRDYNEAFANAFDSQRHNLLHYKEIKSIYNASSTLYHHCKAFSLELEQRTPQEWEKITYETIRKDLEHVLRVLEITRRCGLHKSEEAIKEFLALFIDGKIPNTLTIAEMKSFRTAFGRGQQYLSLIKA